MRNQIRTILSIFFFFHLIIEFNASSTCIKDFILSERERWILRRAYKDVTIEENGAFISTARINYFYGVDLEASPLRNSFYYFNPQALHIGHLKVNYIGESAIIQILQQYEINRLRFWLWENDGRTHTLQVFVSNQEENSEKLIFDGQASSITTLKFPSQRVSKIRFFNKGGNTVNSHMSFYKIQAFYSYEMPK